MKKLIVLLLVLCCLTPVFADMNMIGVNAGIKYGDNLFGIPGIDGVTTIVVEAEGTSLFGMNNNVGLSYGVLAETLVAMGDIEVTDAGMAMGAFGQGVLRIGLGESFKIDLEAGLSGTYYSKDTYFGKNTVLNINAIADAKLVFFFSSTFAMVVSAGAELPLFTNVSLAGQSETVERNEMSLTFSGRVGVSVAL